MNLVRKKKRPKMNLRVSERIRSEGHLTWLRNTCECIAAVGRDPCGGKMQAHHVRHAHNAGTAIKPPDDDAVPLCAFHHRRLHDGGRDWFQQFYGVDLDKSAAAHWQADSYHRLAWERKRDGA